MLAFILIVSCILCWLAYRFYGNFLSKRCGLDDDRETPATTQEDGVDYVPTRASVLFGHHFSSIAGAGSPYGAYGWQRWFQSPNQCPISL